MKFTPRSLITLGAVTMALSNVGRIPGESFGGRTAALTTNDFVLIPLWITLIAIWRYRRRGIVLDAVTLAAGAFALAAAVSTALAVQRYGLDGASAVGVVAYLVRWALYAGWYLLAANCLDRDETHRAWRPVDLAIIAFAAFGIMQSLALPGFAQMVHTGGGDVAPLWDRQGRRLVSTMLDPNFAGMVVVIGLLPRIAREAEGERTSRSILALLTVALILTVSRSSYIALAVGCGAIVLARGVRAPLAGLFFAGAALAAPVLTAVLSAATGFRTLAVDASALQRLVPWSRAVQLVSEHPWLGIGFNAIAFAQKDHGWRAIGGADVSLDGGLLFVAAMTGLVGLALYMGLIGSALRGSRAVWRSGHSSRADRAYATGTMAMTCALLVHSLFSNSLLLPFVMQLIWIRWGGVAVLQRQLQTQLQPPSAQKRQVGQIAPLAKLGALAVLFLTTACDPCSGVGSCATYPTLALAGQIVEGGTGRPVAAVAVTVAGLHATTDAEGLWELSGPMPPGMTTADITVQAPGAAEYTIPALPVRTLTARGDVQNVGRWTSVPYAHYEGTLIFRGAPIAEAAVSFARTGGAAASAIRSSSRSNGVGIFDLEYRGNGALGTVVGVLTVTHPSFPRVSRFAGFTLPLDYRYFTGFTVPFDDRSNLPRRKDEGIVVGGQRVYGGEVIVRATGAKEPGATVLFTRTGGVAMSPATVQTTANNAGFFLLSLDASADGTVVGDLTVRSANGVKSRTYRGVQFATYDSMSFRDSGLWAFGGLRVYGGEVIFRGTGAKEPGAVVLFTRTGGVAMTPATVQTTANNAGFFVLSLDASVDGTVVGDLTVRGASGTKSGTYRGLQLATYDSTSIRDTGLWAFGERWAWAVELWTHDKLIPAPNVSAQFTRTSGPTISPPSISGRTGSDGQIELVAQVTDTGTVVGTITVTPSTGPPRLIPNVRLRTFEGDNLRFGGVYGFGPALRYVGEVLRVDGTPVVGAKVTWTQVSGIPASPTVLVGATDANGRFPLTLIPSADGEVVGTVRVEPVAPYAASALFTFTNLRLNSFENGDLRLAVTYRIPPPP